MDRVRVYFNFHKKLFSVQHQVRTPAGRLSWKVMEHTDSINLLTPDFIVSEAGRQRVLREGRKNVHAFVTGVPTNGTNIEHMERVRYNPYGMKGFQYLDGEPILCEQIVMAVMRIVEGKGEIWVPKRTW